MVQVLTWILLAYICALAIPARRRAWRGQALPAAMLVPLLLAAAPIYYRAPALAEQAHTYSGSDWLAFLAAQLVELTRPLELGAWFAFGIGLTASAYQTVQRSKGPEGSAQRTAVPAAVVLASALVLWAPATLLAVPWLSGLEFGAVFSVSLVGRVVSLSAVAFALFCGALGFRASVTHATAQGGAPRLLPSAPALSLTMLSLAFSALIRGLALFFMAVAAHRAPLPRG